MVFHHILALSSFVNCRFIRAILVAIDLSQAHGWIVAVLLEETKRETGSSPTLLCFSEFVYEKLSFRASTRVWWLSIRVVWTERKGRFDEGQRYTSNPCAFRDHAKRLRATDSPFAQYR